MRRARQPVMKVRERAPPPSVQWDRLEGAKPTLAWAAANVGGERLHPSVSVT